MTNNNEDTPEIPKNEEYSEDETIDVDKTETDDTQESVEEVTDSADAEVDDKEEDNSADAVVDDKEEDSGPLQGELFTREEIEELGPKKSKDSKPEKKPYKIKRFDVKGFFKKHARMPKTNSWSGYKEANASTTMAWVSVVLLFVLLGMWIAIYFAQSQNIGQIRYNNFLLEKDIAEGYSEPVKAVGADGSLQLKDGTKYPPDSIQDTVLVSTYFGTPFYSSKHRTLIAPVDFGSLWKMSYHTWLLASVTIAYDFFTRIRGKNFTGYGLTDVVYEKFPRWMRVTRWCMYGIMLACIGFWVWPFI